MEAYDVDYPLYTGAMAKGIASAEMVIAAGKRRMLASLGAGGLSLDLVEKALDKIQAELPNGPYACNLIHSPFDDKLEKGGVDIFLRRGVRVVEASAFMKLTQHIVRYRVAGLERCPRTGEVLCKNKVIFKVSRTELAEMALRPPPANLVQKLISQGLVTAAQAEMAKEVPMCDDIAVEADSGGHTDNRPLHVIFPLIVELRDRIDNELGMRIKVRVGAGGGIGCPKAALAAFNMGAAFVLTGSVNQMARESGSSDIVREALSKATYSDVVMAPAADMFDQGVKLQVLKKGTMFPARAAKLYDLFTKYNSLDEIPKAVVARLEKSTFKKSIAEVWQETTNFYINRLHDREKIERANKVDPKLKMSLVFRWYLSKSSGWANRGEGDRKLDFQIWCGPAIGSFNDFIRGSYLDKHAAASNGQFPRVAQINAQIVRGAAFLRRCEQVKYHPLIDIDVAKLAVYHPSAPLSL
jgi:PfaD family protein